MLLLSASVFCLVMLLLVTEREREWLCFFFLPLFFISFFGPRCAILSLLFPLPFSFFLFAPISPCFPLFRSPFLFSRFSPLLFSLFISHFISLFLRSPFFSLCFLVFISRRRGATLSCPVIAQGRMAWGILSKAWLPSLFFSVITGRVKRGTSCQCLVKLSEERERESMGKKIFKNLLLPLLYIQGNKKNNVAQNNIVSGFSSFFLSEQCMKRRRFDQNAPFQLKKWQFWILKLVLNFWFVQSVLNCNFDFKINSIASLPNSNVGLDAIWFGPWSRIYAI